MLKNLLVLTALTSLSTAAFAEGGWAQFKPGAFSTLKSTSVTESAGMTIKTVVTTKSTLKELSATEATLTIVAESVTSMNGQETKTPPQTSEMKVPLQVSTTPPSVPPEIAQAVGGPAASAKTETSSETVTIAGKALKCTVSASTVEAGGAKTATKQWVCDDVPGAIVKSESKTDGPAKVEMTMELTEFDAKK